MGTHDRADKHASAAIVVSVADDWSMPVTAGASVSALPAPCAADELPTTSTRQAEPAPETIADRRRWPRRRDRQLAPRTFDRLEPAFYVVQLQAPAGARCAVRRGEAAAASRACVDLQLGRHRWTSRLHQTADCQ